MRLKELKEMLTEIEFKSLLKGNTVIKNNYEYYIDGFSYIHSNRINKYSYTDEV